MRTVRYSTASSTTVGRQCGNLVYRGGSWPTSFPSFFFFSFSTCAKTLAAWTQRRTGQQQTLYASQQTSLLTREGAEVGAKDSGSADGV